MRQLLIKTILLIMSVCLLGPSLKAQTLPQTTFDSIEWAAVDSNAVVKGHVTSVERTDGITVSYHVDETLKGPAQKEIKFNVLVGYPVPKHDVWDNQTESLLFLVESRRIGNITFSKQRRAMSRFRYSLRMGRAPSSIEVGLGSAIDLESDNKLSCFTSDGQQVQNPDIVLRRVRAAIAETSKGTWAEGKIDLPNGRHVIVPKRLENPPPDTTWGEHHLARFDSASAYDGRRILSGRGTDAYLWDANTGRLIQKFPGGAGDVQAVAFSPDGTQIVTGSAASPPNIEGAITLTDIDKKTLEGHFGVPRAGVKELEFDDRTGRLLTVCDSYGSTGLLQTVWNVFSREAVLVIPGSKVAFSDDATMIAGCSDAYGAIWDARDLIQIAALQAPSPIESEFRTIAFAPYGNRVVTTSRDGIAVWDAETGRQIVKKQITRLSNAVYTKDGTEILVATQDPIVEVVDPETLKVIRNIKCPKKPYKMVLSPDGARLLVKWGSAFFIDDRPDGASLLDVASGKELLRIDGPVNELIGFSPDSKTICMLSPGTSGKHPEYDSKAKAMFYPNRIINEATVWSAETGALIRKLHLQ